MKTQSKKWEPPPNNRTEHPRAVGQYQSHICATSIPEGEERENETEEIFEEVMVKKFSKLMTDTNHKSKIREY